MQGRNKTFLGMLLIGVGCLFLLDNMNILPAGYNIFNIGFFISRLWPVLFLIVPGIAFHYAFLTGRNRDAGLLVPGGILVVVGVTCQLSQMFYAWHLLWPGFILAVAVGLFELYFFGNREEGLLIPVSILGGISVIFFSISLSRWIGFSLTRYSIPAILILAGLILISRNRPYGGKFK